MFEQICSQDRGHILVKHQVLDTITSLSKNENFKEKMEINFDHIVAQLSLSNLTMDMNDYFEYLESFIYNHYSNFTQTNLT
jgi:hypothetical protein